MPEPLPVSLELLLLTRLGIVVMWLAFALFHLTLAVISLALLWWWQVPPSRFAELLAVVPASLSVQWLGILGCSAATLLVLYVLAWRRLYAKLTVPFFFRGVTDGKPLTY